MITLKQVTIKKKSFRLKCEFSNFKFSHVWSKSPPYGLPSSLPKIVTSLGFGFATLLPLLLPASSPAGGPILLLLSFIIYFKFFFFFVLVFLSFLGGLSLGGRRGTGGGTSPPEPKLIGGILHWICHSTRQTRILSLQQAVSTRILLAISVFAPSQRQRTIQTVHGIVSHSGIFPRFFLDRLLEFSLLCFHFSVESLGFQHPAGDFLR